MTSTLLPLLQHWRPFFNGRNSQTGAVTEILEFNQRESEVTEREREGEREREERQRQRDRDIKKEKRERETDRETKRGGGGGVKSKVNSINCCLRFSF